MRSELRLHVQGMDCADEAALIRHVLQVHGILDLNFDLVGRRVDVQFDRSVISAETILEKVQGTGLGAHSHAPGEHVHDDHGVPSGTSHGLTLRFIVTGAALMLAGALWYGLSRASAPGSKYVPARIDGTEITPGHMEPRR